MDIIGPERWPLSQSSQSLEIIYRHAGIGIIMVSRSGHLVEVNPRFCDLLGYTAEELKGRTFLDITHPEDFNISEAWFTDFQKSLPRVVAGEKRYLHKKGHTIWVKLSMSPVFGLDQKILYFVTTVEDITEKRASEALLKNQLKVLEMMASGAPLRETVLKIVEFVESFASGGASVVCLADDRGLNALVGPRFPESYLSKIQNAPIGPVTGPCGAAAHFGQSIFSNNLEVDACWSDRQRQAMWDMGYRSVWAAPTFSMDGKVIGTLNICWKEKRSPVATDLQLLDVATYLTGLAIERHLTEQLLHEQQLKLISASKLASLGEMAGGLAHEINNPLTIIDVQASKLASAAERGNVAADFAKSLALGIHSTTKRISKIISGLRTFARDGEQEYFKNLALEKIIEETLSFCRERFRSHRIDLRLQIEPNLVLHCRGVQISQVILNLLNNAFDAVHEMPEPWVEIRAQSKNQEIEICVIDSGHGVPKHLTEKIFEPFFTTKDVSKGTGLGLSISSAIIRSHQGLLSLNQENPNTCFQIRLPNAGLKENS